MTSPSKEVQELRHAILLFDKSRGHTGADYVTKKITRQQADSEYEDDIAKLIKVFAHHQAIVEIEAKLEVLRRIRKNSLGAAWIKADDGSNVHIDLYIAELEQQKATLLEKKG